MKSLIKLLLKNQIKPKPYSISNTSAGFTLIELLVAMIMTFLILTPLLSFVVNMLDTDRKEQVKSNTEQDMQTAVDFIAQDMSQAVYIYNNTGIVAIQTNLPATSSYGTPVLVFWKRELVKETVPVTSASDCKANPTVSCDDTYVYSLVAYYIDPNNAGTIWSDKAARIRRFSIRDCVKDPNDATGRCITASPTLVSKVDASRANGDTPNDHFKPFNLKLSGADLTEKMKKWPKQINAGQEVAPSFTFVSQPPSGNVLIDYVDKDSTALAPNCTSPDEEQVPQAPATLSGFYACVNSSKNLARVFIRGNAQARLNNTATYNDNNKAYFPTVSAQVQGLGVLGQ